MESKKTHQQEVDEKIVRERKATNMNTPGGQYVDPKPDHIKSPSYKAPRGIRVHDEGPDTWGVGQGSK